MNGWVWVFNMYLIVLLVVQEAVHPWKKQVGSIARRRRSQWDVKAATHLYADPMTPMNLLDFQAPARFKLSPEGILEHTFIEPITSRINRRYFEIPGRQRLHSYRYCITLLNNRSAN